MKYKLLTIALLIAGVLFMILMSCVNYITDSIPIRKLLIIIFVMLAITCFFLRWIIEVRHKKTNQNNAENDLPQKPDSL